MAAQQQFGLEIFELQARTARLGGGEKINVLVGLAIGGTGEDRLQPLGRGEIGDVRRRESGRRPPIGIAARFPLVVACAQSFSPCIRSPALFFISALARRI
jgi:hypothetical protein